MRVEAAVSFFLNRDDEVADVRLLAPLDARLKEDSSLVMPLPPVLLRRTCSVEECGCNSDVRGEWVPWGACSVGWAVGDVKKADCSCADGVVECWEEADASDDSGESGASWAGEEEGRLLSASPSCCSGLSGWDDGEGEETGGGGGRSGSGRRGVRADCWRHLQYGHAGHSGGSSGRGGGGGRRAEVKRGQEVGGGGDGSQQRRRVSAAAMTARRRGGERQRIGIGLTRSGVQQRVQTGRDRNGVHSSRHATTTPVGDRRSSKQ